MRCWPSTFRFKTIRSPLILTIFFFLSALPITAEEFGFDIWTTANGLPQNTVTGVVQTPDGYLWLSTFDGLARFDGLRFTIFDKGNTKGILNNRFSGIFADRDGAVWAVTENGVVTVYRNGAFTSLEPSETVGGSIAIVSGATGNALIDGAQGFYSLQDGKFIPTADQKEKNVRQIYYGKSGAKWNLEQNGVSRHKDGQTTNYPLSLPPEDLTSTISFHTYEDNQGALWLAIKDKLHRLADSKVTTFTQKEIPALNELNLQTTFDDADGSIWFVFGTVNADAHLDGQVVKFKDGQFTSNNLGKSVPATSGITDREGNFWLATTTGLRRLRRKLITSLSLKDGLNRNEVYPLLQTTKGDIFIGTVQGVNRYAEGRITNLSLKYTDNNPLYMRGLWGDPQGRVWLGYQGEGGFGRFEEASSVKRIGKNDIPNGATDFTSDSEGNVWIATEEGLFKYKDDTEIAQYTVKDGLHNDKIITMHFDRDGALWLGTFDGLAKFSNGKFTNFADIENSPKGFVRAIYEDPEGVLWFGTYGDGLVRMRDGKFFNYRVEHGLFNNGVFAILEDKRGNFWMSSNRGIHRVSKQELNDFADGKIPKLSSISYDERDGMPNAECNGGRLPAAIRTNDGKFWFPTMGGVAIVDPEAERVNPSPPPVVIENVLIDRKTIDSQFLQSAIRNPQTAIELSPGQSSLEVNYTGLSLVKSEQVKFKYKLEGFEENWVEAGTVRVANYSYLPHGEYSFRVIAANANGVWNMQGASVKLVVQPFFYQTWWFLGLATVAVALLVWLIYHNRVSHLKEIAETKTQFSRQLIESQEAERKRIASELHDGLGQSLVIIKNRAMLGLNKGDDRERVAKELGDISESASQALDEVREITNNLRPQLLDRLGLTKAIRAMLDKTAGVVEIDAEVDDIDGLFSENQEISVYRIIQESVNNVIKHSNASNAVVTAKRVNNDVTIVVQDNGKGFDTANVNAERRNMGLVGLKERAQLLYGEFSVDSKIGEGTTIRVNIPIFAKT